MKNSKLKGYTKDLENKNKRFSYVKTIRILDVINFIYLDKMKNYDYNQVSAYSNAKYLFDEIPLQFHQIYEFLDNGKILMGTCLLRNIYEEILYIIATAYNNSIVVNVHSNPSDFRDIVKNHCDELLSEYFEMEDIPELYNYLSKMTHVTNLKEVTSYLMKTKKYNKYVSNEIKFMTILIEYMYLSFLFKKSNQEEDILCTDSILVASYVEIINSLYYVANSDQSQKYLKKYFYGEKNQNYLTKKNNELLGILNDFKVEKNNINVTIKKVIKEFNKEIEKSKYIDIANAIIMNSNNMKNEVES